MEENSEGFRDIGYRGIRSVLTGEGRAFVIFVGVQDFFADQFFGFFIQDGDDFMELIVISFAGWESDEQSLVFGFDDPEPPNYQALIDLDLRHGPDLAPGFGRIEGKNPYPRYFNSQMVTFQNPVFPMGIYYTPRRYLEISVPFPSPIPFTGRSGYYEVL